MHVTLRALVLLPLTTGCVATAVYGSARPLAPGQVQTTLLLEQGVRAGAVLKPAQMSDSFVGPIPGPGVEARFGVAPGFDFGARLSTASGVVVDGKIALVQGPRLAIALDPALAAGTYISVQDNAGAQGSLRLLAGWRFSEIAELVGHGAGGVLFDGGDPAQKYWVPTWGGGLSVLLHLTPSFALQPSVASLWRFDRASWAPEVAVGMGFVLGEAK